MVERQADFVLAETAGALVLVALEDFLQAPAAFDVAEPLRPPRGHAWIDAAKGDEPIRMGLGRRQGRLARLRIGAGLRRHQRQDDGPLDIVLVHELEQALGRQFAAVVKPAEMGVDVDVLDLAARLVGGPWRGDDAAEAVLAVGVPDAEGPVRVGRL